ncbi:MAG: AmmeMemoRadiSam system protein B [Candidatus Lambdaproteobacteria bacterium]|nr:AmmeMemoRadiSam system protein B [Candidatus Lambdaproteobacteria bacterium]
MTFHRRMAFAGSWYPRSAAECDALLRELGGVGYASPAAPGAAAPARFGIAPHAGWVYSGRLAAQVFECLVPDPALELVVVLGGHLGRRDAVVAMVQGTWQTPFGDFAIYEGFTGELAAQPRVVIEDEARHAPDNSVELQLPLARRRYPRASLLPLRVPPSELAIGLGRALGGHLRRSGLRWVLVASTDLTHYGPNYDFEPQGRGPAASQWMTRNDQAFIDAVRSGSAEQVLSTANACRNACSAGAVAALCACANSCADAERSAGEAATPRRFELLEHTSSAEAPPHSTVNVVGYMGAVLA